MNIKEFQAAYPGLLTEQGLESLRALTSRVTADPVAIINQALCAHANVVTPRRVGANGRRPQWTAHEIIDTLAQFYKLTGVFPTISGARGSTSGWTPQTIELAKSVGLALPDQSTMRRKLGSFKDLKKKIVAMVEAADEPVKAVETVLPARVQTAVTGHSIHTNKLAYDLVRYFHVYEEWPSHNQVDWLPQTKHRAELAGLELMDLGEARDRFGSVCKLFDVAEKLRRTHRRKTVYTDEELLDLLIKARNTHGFWPVTSDNGTWKGFRSSKWLPASSMYIHRFGSLTAARELAQARMAGATPYDLSGIKGEVYQEALWFVQNTGRAPKPSGDTWVTDDLATALSMGIKLRSPRRYRAYFGSSKDFWESVIKQVQAAA